MQHLNFTLRAVASVQADGAIGRIQSSFGGAAFQRFRRGADNRTVLQLQHIVLNAMQQIVRRNIDKCENFLRRFDL
ncbi:hypothetical protein D3C71_1485410 [compost metagenome]